MTSIRFIACPFGMAQSCNPSLIFDRWTSLWKVAVADSIRHVPYTFAPRRRGPEQRSDRGWKEIAGGKIQQASDQIDRLSRHGELLEKIWRERMPREIHSARSETGSSIGPIADDGRSCPISHSQPGQNHQSPSGWMRGPPAAPLQPCKRTKRSPPEYRICSWVSLNIHKYAALADGQSLGLVRLVAGVSARLKSSECSA